MLREEGRPASASLRETPIDGPDADSGFCTPLWMGFVALSGVRNFRGSKGYLSQKYEGESYVLGPTEAKQQQRYEMILGFKVERRL